MADLVWLMSYPESGSRILGKFLFAYFRRLKAEPSDLEIRRLVVDETDGRHWEQVSALAFESLKPADIHRFRPIMQQTLTGLHENPVLVESGSVNGNFDGIRLVTPEATAGVIYVVRNPIDVVRAFVKKRRMSPDQAIRSISDDGFFPENGPNHLPTFCASWKMNVQSWTEEPFEKPVLVVRYEDLKDKPEEAFGQIMSFLRIDAPEDRFRQAIAASGIDKEDRAAELTEEQIAKLRETQGEIMAKFGY